MLRTAAALAAVITGLGIVLAPAAEAAPDKTRSSSESNNSAPTKPKAVNPSGQSPKITRPRHLAGHPAGDWRLARKQTMDRYFDSIREKREQQIRNWSDALHR